MVGVPGVEPGTSALSVLRSNQLSYTPEIYSTPKKWSRRWDSNPQQSAWKAETLAIELRLHNSELLEEAPALYENDNESQIFFVFFFTKFVLAFR